VPADNSDSVHGSSTSLSLLDGLRLREERAWHRLVDLFGPLVYRWCRNRGVPAGDVPDLVQDTFQAVAIGIGGFRREKAGDTFRGWIWTIARNEVRDYFKRQEKNPHGVGGTDCQFRISQHPDAFSDAEQSEAQDDKRDLLRRALHSIKSDFAEHTWQAFWRMTVDGQSAAEIAHDLGMSKSGVRIAKHRVLTRLREEFHGLLDWPG
jgi:RNA polymerase sigma-70 factor (ECF subfamily)